MSLNLKKKYLILMCLSGLVISIDQITKLYVHTQFQLHESIPVLGSFFSITYVRNFGAAFGIMGQSTISVREMFFLMIPPVACLTILFIMRSVKDNDLKQTLALSSIFAGALGNYIDRLQFRYVIDFLDFHYGQLSWPAFNIADMAIVGGVFSLIIFMLREKEKSPS
ncbi:MAG: signal peptidase II [Pseudobdellovibrio sp.]